MGSDNNRLSGEVIFYGAVVTLAIVAVLLWLLSKLFN